MLLQQFDHFVSLMYHLGILLASHVSLVPHLMQGLVLIIFVFPKLNTAWNITAITNIVETNSLFISYRLEDPRI